LPAASAGRAALDAVQLFAGARPDHTALVPQLHKAAGQGGHLLQLGYTGLLGPAGAGQQGNAGRIGQVLQGRHRAARDASGKQHHRRQQHQQHRRAADAPVPHTLAGRFQIFDPPFRKRLVTLRTVAIFSHRS